MGPTRYRLRWRFDFANRPSKYGMWNAPGPGASTQAWSQNKEGMVRASVEGEDLRTKETKILAQCDGHDFRNFQWMAVGRLRGFPTDTANVRPITHLVGMKILTTDTEICVFGSGQVETAPLPEPIKQMHFATYGK